MGMRAGRPSGGTKTSGNGATRNAGDGAATRIFEKAKASPGDTSRNEGSFGMGKKSVRVPESRSTKDDEEE